MRTQAIRERIEQTIIEEINITNLITQGEPENWLPKFVQTLTDRITEIVADEITYKNR